MRRSREGLAWALVGVVLVVLAIPWFMWGTDTVVAGLPIWLWWHVGWMGLASLVFWLFARRAWGIGIESDEGSSDTPSGSNSRVDAGGERR